MNRKLLFFAILILCIFHFQFNVKAADTPTPVFTKKLTWNIERVYYYLGTGSTTYSSTISLAANNWVYTGFGYNKLYPNTRAYNIINGTVDFYGTNLGDDNVIAETRYFVKINGVSNRVYPNTSDWLYAEIHINPGTFESLSLFNRQGTISHEFGHAWGLAHNHSNPNSIMSQLGDGRVVNTVQQVDQDAFNSKY